MAFYDGDVCPTCSSDSSSDSELDDPYAYQVQPRKAYGGVRLSYVPNDRRRAKLMSDPRQEYVPRNVHKHHSVRAGSLQPQSLPPPGPRQQPQQQQQMVAPAQPQQPQVSPPSAAHMHQHQVPANGFYPSHPGHHRMPQGHDPKDKDKCIIS